MLMAQIRGRAPASGPSVLKSAALSDLQLTVLFKEFGSGSYDGESSGEDDHLAPRNVTSYLWPCFGHTLGTREHDAHASNYRDGRPPPPDVIARRNSFDGSSIVMQTGSRRFLLAAGADVNARDPRADGTVLHEIVSQNDYYWFKPPGWTAEKQMAVLRLLMDAGVDVNAKAGIDITALQIASKEANEAIVRALLVGGADSTTHERGAALEVAMTRHELDERVVRALLDDGADPNANEHWRSPLCAALKEHRDIRGHGLAAVDLFLKAGADPNRKCPGKFRGYEAEYTAFHLACTTQSADVVRLLLRHGADVDRKTKSKFKFSGKFKFPDMRASPPLRKPPESKFKFLGFSPLSIARERCKYSDSEGQAIEQMLLEAGARK